MEHLRNKCYSELSADIDENGNVNIVDFLFTPDKILEELEPEGYSEYFNDWLEKRRLEMLSKGEEILSFHNNRSRFSALKSAYKSGSVIPFVGAGLSISSGYPGWTDFLLDIRSETRIQKEEIESLFDEGKYEEAAQKISDGLPDGGLDEILENIFGLNNELNGSVQMLPYVFEGSAVTTNFDNVLKRCYENANRPFSEVLLGSHAVDLPKQVGRGERVLVKLHGKANSRIGRVLTSSEYQEQYEGIIKLSDVISALSTRTLLFMGCSLTTDRTFLALCDLKASKSLENLVRHYALVPLKNGEDRIARRDLLAKANIFPIWYKEEDGHELCLEAIFYMLLED
ncbi:SIR2 family protein [Leptospira terpstrae]|uniref:SIR2 family protein n=1 Tax=Leptospira terpstrae TaxID=293075 RepID=UPI003CFCD1DB